MMKNALLLIKYMPKIVKLIPQLIQLLDSINCAIRGRCGTNNFEAFREKTKFNEAVSKGSLKDIMELRDRLLR